MILTIAGLHSQTVQLHLFLSSVVVVLCGSRGIHMKFKGTVHLKIQPCGDVFGDVCRDVCLFSDIINNSQEPKQTSSNLQIKPFPQVIQCTVI